MAKGPLACLRWREKGVLPPAGFRETNQLTLRERDSRRLPVGAGKETTSEEQSRGEALQASHTAMTRYSLLDAPLPMIAVTKWPPLHKFPLRMKD